MKSRVSLERLVWLCSETPEAKPWAARWLFQRYEIREPVICPPHLEQPHPGPLLPHSICVVALVCPVSSAEHEQRVTGTRIYVEIRPEPPRVTPCLTTGVT